MPNPENPQQPFHNEDIVGHVNKIITNLRNEGRKISSLEQSVVQAGRIIAPFAHRNPRYVQIENLSFGEKGTEQVMKGVVAYDAETDTASFIPALRQRESIYHLDTPELGISQFMKEQGASGIAFTLSITGDWVSNIDISLYDHLLPSKLFTIMVTSAGTGTIDSYKIMDFGIFASETNVPGDKAMYKSIEKALEVGDLGSISRPEELFFGALSRVEQAITAYQEQ